MSLIKNTGWNILGLALPLAMAIPAMGILARILGVERFGMFTIAYALVGYASVFDAGLSRAVIRSVSGHRDQNEKVASILGTSLFVVTILGIAIAFLTFIFSPTLTSFLNVSPAIHHEMEESLKLLGICVPALLLTQVWRAYLEGMENFSSLNIQQITTSPFVIILPVLGVLINASLLYAVIGLVLGRWIVAGISWKLCSRHMPKEPRKFRRDIFIELLNFGGWVTLSNIIGPLMGFIDRFAVSHLSGSSMVAHYSGPSDMVARLSLFPGAVARALFPRLSYLKNEDGNAVYKRTLLFVALSSMCIAAPFFMFSSEILGLWLGKEYAGDAAYIFRILLIGFVFNSLAQITFAKIQAAGHAKWTAFIHIIELFPYLIVLYYLTANYSIYGAAFAFSLRALVDFILLFVAERFGIRKT